jgi:hypothetical protein
VGFALGVDAENAPQPFTGLLCEGCLMNPQPAKRRSPHSLVPGGSDLKYRANQKTITVAHLITPTIASDPIRKMRSGNSPISKVENS